MIKIDPEKFAKAFREHGDIKWLVRHAQEKALEASLKRPGGFAPVDFDEFMEILTDPETLEDPDLAQACLNKAVSETLVAGYRFKSPPSVVKDMYAAKPTEMLNPILIPDQHELPAVARQLIERVEQSDLEGKLKSQLQSSLMKEGGVASALEHVLALVCFRLWGTILYKNPILAFLPSHRAQEFVKMAANPNPPNKGMRVSDLIHALKITSGKLANELLQAQEGMTSPFTTSEDKKRLRKIVANNPERIVVIHAYIDFLERALKSLSEYMAEDPDREWIRYSKSADAPFLTNDPFIGSGELNPNSFADLLRGSNPKVVNFTTKLWDGSDFRVTSFKAPQTEIVTSFVRSEVRQEGFSEKVAKQVADNINHFKEFSRNENTTAHIFELKEIFAGTSDATLLKIHQEILDYLQVAIVVPDPEEFEDVQDDPDAAKFLAQVHKDTQAKSIAEAKKRLLGMFESRATLKGDLYEEKMGKLIDDIARNEVVPASPHEVHLLSQVNYSIPEARPATASVALADVFPTTNSILNSKQFRIRFTKNDMELAQYEEEHKEKPDEQMTKIVAGVEKLKTKEGMRLLHSLGYNSDVMRHVFEPKAFEQEYSKVMAQVFSKTPEELQKALGDIPLDSLYHRMGELFATGAESRLLCKIACRWSAAAKEESYKEGDVVEEQQVSGGHSIEDCRKICKDINIAAYHEAERFLRERFRRIQKGRVLVEDLKTSLKTSTVGGKVAHWHQREVFKSRDEEPNFSKFMYSTTLMEFGGFLRDETRAKIMAQLEQNKRESKEIGDDKFVWNDPSNPRPRTWGELAEVVGAFADPIPGQTEAGKAHIKFKQDSKRILPGQRLTAEDLADMKARGEVSPDTAFKALDRKIMQVMKIGGDFVGVRDLATAFEKRKEEILSINKDYAKDIIRFKKDKPETKSPFTQPGLYSDEAISSENEKHEHVATSGEAIDYIELNAYDVLDKQTVQKLKQKILSTYPRTNVVIWASNRKFAEFFAKELAPLIDEGPEAINELLKRIDSSFELQSATPTESPKVKEVQDPMIGEINTSLKEIERALKEPTEVDPVKAERQILRFNELKKLVLKRIAKAKSVKTTDPTMDRLITFVSQRLNELGQKIQEVEITLRNSKRIEEENKLRELREIGQQIIRVVSTPPTKWGDKEALDLTQVILSLTDGSPEEIVHPSVITRAAEDLKMFLSQLQKVNAMTPAEKKSKLPKNFEASATKMLRDRLQDFRAGSSLFVDFEEEPISKKDDYHEIDFEPETPAVAPAPVADVKKTIVRKKT